MHQISTVDPQQRTLLEIIAALAWKRRQISETHVQLISKLLTHPRISLQESEVVDTLINGIIHGQIEVILTSEEEL